MNIRPLTPDEVKIHAEESERHIALLHAHSPAAAYRAWIAAYVGLREGYQLRGLCGSATKDMIAVFPELRRVAGRANGHEHFWCVATDGAVVDPTAAQFETDAIDYAPFEPGDSIRVGRCMNCGTPIYAEVECLDDPKYARDFCDDDCRREFCPL